MGTGLIAAGVVSSRTPKRDKGTRLLGNLPRQKKEIWWCDVAVICFGENLDHLVGKSGSP